MAKTIREAVTERGELRLHPFCNECGWRKGGLDSWNGRACKCGFSAPPFSAEIHALFDRIDEIDLNLTVAGERDEPMPMGEEDALRAERAELQSRLAVALGRPL